jgi:Phage capsid protein
MIPDHFTTQFGKNFELGLQQITSRLQKAAVVETGCTGEAKTHNKVNAVSDNETTGERYGDTIWQELDTEKRWIRPRKFDLATPDAPFDETLLAPTIMPGGTHIQLHQAAYGRRTDRVFIEGMFGTNYKGKDGTTATEIVSANLIADTFNYTGAASCPLTIDKILHAKAILTDNESYGDDARARGITLWGVMTPNMEESLLSLANAGTSGAGNRLFSRDYMPPTLDANGNISFFLGVNWMRSTLLPYQTGYGAIWTSDAVFLDFWKVAQTTVSVRADKKNATQFFTEYAMNACRSDDAKVVRIACLNLVAGT